MYERGDGPKMNEAREQRIRRWVDALTIEELRQVLFDVVKIEIDWQVFEIKKIKGEDVVRWVADGEDLVTSLKES